MQQTNPFPTFSYYWRALTRPKRRYKVNNSSRQIISPAAKQGGTFSCEGEITVSPSGDWAVNGQTFVVDNDTWVFGDIKPGVQARVIGITRGAKRKATKIVISG